MRNNEYKKAFNQLNDSYKTIDNLYDITAQSKHKAITLPQKIIAMVMAFVLVVGGGFGISYSVSDKASMGIYIANANEVANIKKATPQDFTYQIYISEGNKNAMNKWQKDKQKLLDDAERLGNDNYTASVNSSSSNAANEKSGKERRQKPMRKRNYTVTIRMNKEEYDLFQSKVKESGRTQQEVVIKAIADLKIVSAEDVEELKRLIQMFADFLCQLRGATTNINQIARKLHTDGEIPNDSMLYFLNKNILKYRKESERIWQLIRRLISGQIHMEQ